MKFPFALPEFELAIALLISLQLFTTQALAQPTGSADCAQRRGPAHPTYCQLAADYSESLNGLSVLVMVDDRVVFEQYHNGHGPFAPYRLASGTKSFWSIAAICAEADGLLTLDEHVADTITQWRDDPRKSKIMHRIR